MPSAKPSINSRINRHYHQGVFVPKNPEKYIGNANNIVYRSQWERIFLHWCDTNDSVLKYSSEECVIPYISPIDMKKHRYFVDFFVTILQDTGKVQNFLVEIKPFAQTHPPKKPKTINESYNESVRTYLVNQAKWKAAERVCQERGWKFMVLTERELFRTVKRKKHASKK